MGQIEKYFMEKNRLETLVDGIFAIVMTLLVMNVVVPHREEVLNNIGFMQLLKLRLHDIVNYALSFCLLAIFWIQHHKQAHFIKRTNAVHIWINISSMFFLALIPFSTSLVTEFPEEDIAELVFGLNLMIIGVFFMFNWLYATKNKRLVDQNISERELGMGRNSCIIFIVVAVISIILSQIHPAVSSDIF
jgi:uncharacterized membrane protein